MSEHEIPQDSVQPGDQASADGAILIEGCRIYKGTVLADGKGFRVEAGGYIFGGYIRMRGAVIRALPEGGFVIEDTTRPGEVT